MAKKKSQTAEVIEHRRKVNERAMVQIDALREKRGLSINKMAAAGGISAQAWFKWAKGESSPSVENVDKLVAGLKGRFLVVVQDGGRPVAAVPTDAVESIGEEDGSMRRILELLAKVSPELRHRLVRQAESWIVAELGIAPTVSEPRRRRADGERRDRRALHRS